LGLNAALQGKTYPPVVFVVEEQRVRAFAAAVGHHNVLFLRNHGIIAIGRTPGEAFMWCYRAERACRMQLAIQQAGVETVALPDEVIDETIERNRFLNSPEGYRAIGVHEWPALLRKLDRIDPSYRS